MLFKKDCILIDNIMAKIASTFPLIENMIILYISDWKSAHWFKERRRRQRRRWDKVEQEGEEDKIKWAVKEINKMVY